MPDPCSSSDDEEDDDDEEEEYLPRGEIRPVWTISSAEMAEVEDVKGGSASSHLALGCCIVAWYVLSISLTLGNKMVFAGGKGITAAVPCPLIITSLHIGMKVVLARLAMRCLDVQRISMGSWRRWLTRIAPAGLAAALDIGLSNASFLYITVTQYTLIKSSAPMWILLLSVALGLQQPKPSLCAVVCAIAAGIALASMPDTPDFGVLQPGPPAASTASMTWSNDQTARDARARSRDTDSPESFDAEHAQRKALFWLAMDGDDGAASLVPPAHFFRAAHAARRQWQQALDPNCSSAWRCARLARRPTTSSSAQPVLPPPPPPSPLPLPTSAVAASAKRSAAAEATAEATAEAEERARTAFGMGLVLCAAISGAFRWAWMEFLMRPAGAAVAASPSRSTDSRTPPPPTASHPLHPLALISATASFGFCSMLPVAVALEAPRILHVTAAHPDDGYARGLLFRAALATLGGGLIAFSMLLVELRIVQLASSLTLSIAGILKEVLTVAASAVLLGDELTLSNALGLGLCISGIAGYQRLKLKQDEAHR